MVSNNAIKVLQVLKQAGYESLLVGGCVRDMLLGLEPKDFDVATNAEPEQIKSLFSNCRLIGRRFRLAHIYFRKEIIEVATLRAQHDGSLDGGKIENGRIIRDNVFGTIDEDALRRDFTMNALYYNFDDFSVISYADGLKDISNSVIKLIGDPTERYKEDPVRMLRAVRFASKLGFRMDHETENQIYQQAKLIETVPGSRLFDEMLKLFLNGYAVKNYESLIKYKLFHSLFPETSKHLDNDRYGINHSFLLKVLENTDKRILNDQTVTPAFLYAAFMWQPVISRAKKLQAQGKSRGLAIQIAGREAISGQASYVSFPKRFSYPARDIWMLQARFANKRGGKPFRLFMHKRFRAAYDFLVLRAESGEELEDSVDWWRRFQESNEEAQKEMCFVVNKKKGTKKRRGKGKKVSTEKNTDE